MKIVVVYGGDAVRRSLQAALENHEPPYEVETFGTPGEALSAVYDADFIQDGWLFIGFQFSKAGISAEDLIKRLRIPHDRIVRISVLEREPCELNGLKCISPDAQEVLRILACV